VHGGKRRPGGEVNKDSCVFKFLETSCDSGVTSNTQVERMEREGGTHRSWWEERGDLVKL